MIDDNGVEDTKATGDIDDGGPNGSTHEISYDLTSDDIDDYVGWKITITASNEGGEDVKEHTGSIKAEAEDPPVIELCPNSSDCPGDGDIFTEPRSIVLEALITNIDDLDTIDSEIDFR